MKWGRAEPGRAPGYWAVDNGVSWYIRRPGHYESAWAVYRNGTLFGGFRTLRAAKAAVAELVSAP